MFLVSRCSQKGELHFRLQMVEHKLHELFESEFPTKSTPYAEAEGSNRLS